MDGDIQRALDDAMTAHAELHEEVERLTNSLQQLKAEIAAALDSCVTDDYKIIPDFAQDLVDKLRQLSAV